MTEANDVPPALQPHVAQLHHLHGCFVRYFAGRPRPACDLLYLHELVRRLERHAQATASIAGLRDLAATRLATLRHELAEIEAARATLTTPAARAAMLAALANQQFLLYDRNIATRQLSTRRPMLLARLVTNLTQLRDGMRAIAAEIEHADNVANIGKVEVMLARVVEESRVAETERAQPRAELVRLLGAHLNAELVAYRKTKPDLELEQLAGLCDRVGELAYQMLELAEETADSVNQANLRLASRMVVELEAAYEAARARQGIVTIAQLVDSAPSLHAQLACAQTSEDRRREAMARLDAFLDDPLVRQLVVDARSSPGTR